MADRKEHVPLDDGDIDPRDSSSDTPLGGNAVDRDGSAETSTGKIGGLGNTADLATEQDDEDLRSGLDSEGNHSLGDQVIDTDEPLRDRDTELPDR